MDEAREAGEFVWDVGAAHTDADFELITDPELTITYSYQCRNLKSHRPGDGPHPHPTRARCEALSC